MGEATEKTIAELRNGVHESLPIVKLAEVLGAGEVAVAVAALALVGAERPMVTRVTPAAAQRS